MILFNVIFALAGLPKQSVQDGCDNMTEVQKCADDVDDIRQRLGLSGSQVNKEFCREVQKFTGCLKNFADKCPDKPDPDKGDKNSKSDKDNKNSKSDKDDKNSKSDKGDKNSKSDKGDKNSKSDKDDKNDKIAKWILDFLAGNATIPEDATIPTNAPTGLTLANGEPVIPGGTLPPNFEIADLDEELISILFEILQDMKLLKNSPLFSTLKTNHTKDTVKQLLNQINEDCKDSAAVHIRRLMPMSLLAIVLIPVFGSLLLTF